MNAADDFRAISAALGRLRGEPIRIANSLTADRQKSKRWEGRPDPYSLPSPHLCPHCLGYGWVPLPSDPGVKVAWGPCSHERIRPNDGYDDSSAS